MYVCEITGHPAASICKPWGMYGSLHSLCSVRECTAEGREGKHIKSHQGHQTGKDAEMKARCYGTCEFLILWYCIKKNIYIIFSNLLSLAELLVCGVHSSVQWISTIFFLPQDQHLALDIKRWPNMNYLSILSYHANIKASMKRIIVPASLFFIFVLSFSFIISDVCRSQYFGM